MLALSPATPSSQRDAECGLRSGTKHPCPRAAVALCLGRSSHECAQRPSMPSPVVGSYGPFAAVAPPSPSRSGGGTGLERPPWWASASGLCAPYTWTAPTRDPEPGRRGGPSAAARTGPVAEIVGLLGLRGLCHAERKITKKKKKKMKKKNGEVFDFYRLVCLSRYLGFRAVARLVSCAHVCVLMCSSPPHLLYCTGYRVHQMYELEYLTPFAPGCLVYTWLQLSPQRQYAHNAHAGTQGRARAHSPRV